MRKIITYLYKFEELPERAKKRAIEEFCVRNLDDHDWQEHIQDDAKHIGSLMGIEIDNVYFSGFCSQGDGACFTGTYAYKESSITNVKLYTPGDGELHGIVEELFKVQRSYSFQLTAKITHFGQYYHSYSTAVETDPQSERTVRILRRFMDWIYNELEKEYEHLQSDEGITETLIANSYEFNEDGVLT